MAKIEIVGSPEELERISVFLNHNDIKFSLVNDYGDHSLEETKKFNDLIKRFK